MELRLLSSEGINNCYIVYGILCSEGIIITNCYFQGNNVNTRTSVT
jgi:hypothetical protein